ncbi:OmpP1/FadL family transporter [Agarivorans sp. QJM3NY_25]|uniref:OmpP1/FadL family transporter n=1 Tax=Agarivorans sp. QJM3NY_25 TaxID=3421430 RepID=UPI003D7CEEFB
MMMQLGSRLSLFTIAVLSSPAYAAGSLVQEMSKLNVGTAGAGSAVLADNASTAYSNPAAMAYFSERQLAVNLAAMDLQVQYHDQRSSALDSDNAGGVQAYGSLYWLEPLSDTLAVGASLVATGGSALDYGKQYAGALSLNSLQLSVLQFNPSLSYRLSEAWSLGAGIQVDYANFEQQMFRDHAVLETDSFAFGYNLGLSYQINHLHRLGASYRSAMHHNFGGHLRSSSPLEGDVGINLVHPAQFELSGLHQLSQPMSMVWSLGWEQWSANEITYIELNNQQLAEKNRDFKDVWFAAIGGRYQLNPTLRLDAGLGYTSSPLDDASRQSADLPVAEQHRYSIGATYQWNEKLSMNVYYSYVDYGSPAIQSGLMNGYFNNHNQFIGVTLNHSF